MVTIKKFEQYYDYEIRDCGLFFGRKGDSLKKFPRERHMYLVYDQVGVNSTNVDTFLADGLVDKVYAKDIYELLGMDKEEYCKLEYGSDVRSFNYLRAVKNNIGYSHTVCGYEKDIPEFETISTREVESKNITKGVLADGRFILYFEVITAIDDYLCVGRIFTQEPQFNYEATISNVEKIEDILLRRRTPYFHCWECGNKAHWLDTEGTLSDKLLGLKEHCCCS